MHFLSRLSAINKVVKLGLLKSMSYNQSKATSRERRNFLRASLGRVCFCKVRNLITGLATPKLKIGAKFEIYGWRREAEKRWRKRR